MAKPRRPNNRLKSQRLNGGWTQNDVVERMHRAALGRALPEPRGLDANYVSRWERGTVPHPYHAYLLCLAFQSSPAKLGLPASELGLATEVSAYGTLAPEQSATNRREFGKAFIGSVAAGVGFTDLELLTDISGTAPPVWPLSALAGNGKLLELEVGSVEHVAAVTFHLEQLRRQAPGDYLLRLVASHINFMRSHLPSTPAKSRRLLSAVAEAAVLAGRLSFWDVRDSAGAARYFELARRAAEEAEDRVLSAYALAFIAEFTTYIGRPRESLDYLEATRSLRDVLPPRVDAWVAAVQAEACAYLAEGHDTRVALEQAHAAMALATRHDEEPAWIDFFDEGRLGGYEGVCLVRLGDAPNAVQVLEKATRVTNPSFTKYRSEIASDLAWARVQQGQVEESCRLLALTFELAHPVGYKESLHRLAHVRQQLQPYRDTAAVRELDELLVVNLSR
jgi:transcriptional regulator with XRE-family HTH domain/tetratricopeptide (TPR) repeat protein